MKQWNSKTKPLSGGNSLYSQSPKLESSQDSFQQDRRQRRLVDIQHGGADDGADDDGSGGGGC